MRALAVHISHSRVGWTELCDILLQDLTIQLKRIRMTALFKVGLSEIGLARQLIAEVIRGVRSGLCYSPPKSPDEPLLACRAFSVCLLSIFVRIDEALYLPQLKYTAKHDMGGAGCGWHMSTHTWSHRQDMMTDEEVIVHEPSQRCPDMHSPAAGLQSYFRGTPSLHV